MMQRMTLLEDVLYEPRPLLQHVLDDPAHAPVREPDRKAGFDELFFDLIIVAVVRRGCTCLSRQVESLAQTFVLCVQIQCQVLCSQTDSFSLSSWCLVTLLW
jgi:hypothetical protein